jgi:TatD DNase family protein
MPEVFLSGIQSLKITARYHTVSKKKKDILLPVLDPGAVLVDTHCHLDMMGGGAEVEQLIRRAAAAGVRYVITIGIDRASSAAAVHYAERYDNIYAAVGIHPHHAREAGEEALAELTVLARRKRVVAWGEIGVDTVKNYAPLDVQQQAFVRQLHLAREIGLPVIIHNREAHALIYELLRDNGPFPAGGVIHCFSGDREIAEKFVELGFYISIPGVITFNKAEMLEEAVRAVPLEALLVETDAPFLAPVPFRGKPNEPLYTLYTARKIAELKGVSLSEVAARTTANVRKLFGIAVEPEARPEGTTPC